MSLTTLNGIKYATYQTTIERYRGYARPVTSYTDGRFLYEFAHQNNRIIVVDSFHGTEKIFKSKKPNKVWIHDCVVILSDRLLVSTSDGSLLRVELDFGTGIFTWHFLDHLIVSLERNTLHADRHFIHPTKHPDRFITCVTKSGQFEIFKFDIKSKVTRSIQLVNFPQALIVAASHYHNDQLFFISSFPSQVLAYNLKTHEQTEMHWHDLKPEPINAHRFILLSRVAFHKDQLFYLEVFDEPARREITSLKPRLMNLNLNNGKWTQLTSSILNELASNSWYRDWKHENPLWTLPSELLNVDEAGILTIHVAASDGGDWESNRFCTWSSYRIALRSPDSLVNFSYFAARKSQHSFRLPQTCPIRNLFSNSSV